MIKSLDLFDSFVSSGCHADSYVWFPRHYAYDPTKATVVTRSEEAGHNKSKNYDQPITTTAMKTPVQMLYCGSVFATSTG